MSTTYDAPYQLTGYSDSVNAGGRIGSSAFCLFVDFEEVGAPAATGLVVTDVVDKIGALPENCVVTKVAAQVAKEITVLSDDGVSAIPLTLKAGNTTLASLTLGSINGPELGAQWKAVSLGDGTIGVDGSKTDLSLTVGAVLDDADSPVATAITGGVLALVFFVDYMPESDELTGLFSIKDEISDGGNTATEVTNFGLGY